MEKVKLEITGLSVELNKNKIIHDLSLRVMDGEFMSLLGPSGCGKSTLLKTVAGINDAASGTIFLDGNMINDVPAYRRGAVIVFQDMRLFPNMNVADNVAYPLRIKGVSGQERRVKAEEYLDSVKLSGYGDRRVSELSGGQQQRVALARALAAEPKLLLLDEPFSSLDENLREDMRVLVKDLHREFGMTTIMVTHDRREALSMADRVAVMFDGMIVQTGTPAGMLAADADTRVREYFRDFAFIHGTVTDGIFRAENGEGLICRVNRPDGEYDLMLGIDISEAL